MTKILFWSKVKLKHIAVHRAMNVVLRTGLALI